jgi:hypothetical protein
MNEKIINKIREVYAYAGHVDDWNIIKRELLKSLPSQERKKFGESDIIAKIELESQVAALWTELSGRPIIFRENEKQH